MAPEILHATSVSVNERAMLIVGPSGAGKSALALEMMALGAGLIADDRTQVTSRDNQIYASCPPAISGKIEARGIGILAAEPSSPAPIVLAVDLGREETERLPPKRHMLILNSQIPLLHKPAIGHFPAALMQYLKLGLME